MRICMIGAGNVGTRLGLALHQAGHQVTTVYSRSLSRAGRLAAQISAQPTDQFTQLDPSAEVVILAVHDDAIRSVYLDCESFVAGKLVLHTAGSIPVTVFEQHQRCGALWPVQTLSASHASDMHEVPFVVSGNTAQTVEEIDALARTVSNVLYHLSDDARLKLHLCATLVNNFTNHLYTVADQLLAEDHIPFEILQPIIRETAEKITRMAPGEAQTGAAVRGDVITMEKHLELLRDKPELHALYTLLSQSIQKMKQ